MANAEHVKLIEMGADVVDAWLDNNPTQVLDLMGVDFRGKSLEGASLRRARLDSANLRGANLKNANLTQAVLHFTDLRGADLSGAKLFRAELLDTDVSEAIFRGTDLTRAKLSRLKGLDRATFKETLFVNAELHELDFTGAEMIEVDLSGADISHACFDKANLAKANFLEAVTGENTSFRETRGLNRAKNLATIKPLTSPKYFEYCHRSFFEQIMDWEKIRIFGKLPLFGPSYLALILIPAFFYGLGKYNDIVAIVRAWANETLRVPSEGPHTLATVIHAHLHPLAIPDQSLLLLISTILLAIGATLFAFFCPSRIKEFSKDQWTDQLEKPLVHYWPLSWRHRPIRITCATCYVLGGIGVLWVIVTKLLYVGDFIVRYANLSS